MKLPFLPSAAAFFVSFSFSVLATTHYVDVSGMNPVSPYTSWVTAATNIQAAAQIAIPGDLILVTNGIYQTGGYSLSGSNRVAVMNAITIQSVNGPAVTTIAGYQVPGTTNGVNAVRCVFLATGAILSGFTLTNGATQNFDTGGGVKCASPDCLVTNCVIVGNAAYDGGGGAFSGTLVNCSLVGNYGGSPSVGTGGGATQSTLFNCLVARNYSGYVGGGVFQCMAINCTVVSNSSSSSIGGADGGTQKNCIIYYNSPANASSVNLTNCCTIPDFGVNDITNAPQFANLAAGDFHLSAASPCINAGNNSFITTFITNGTDLDGNPRIIAGTVDIGAYEFQSPIHYVSVSNSVPVSPFTNWVTAATNIQDAVDISAAGDFILVSNGIYQSGGRIVYGSSSNRVVINKAVTVQSMNGPSSTIIMGIISGNSSVRCAYLTNGATLSGFTLTNGSSRFTGNLTNEQSGGGVWCESSTATISNCVLVANFAEFYGGATYQGTFNNCVISNNQAFIDGGGTYGANLNNCIVITNKTIQGFGGGGTAFGTLNNCLITGIRAVWRRRVVFDIE